MKKMLIKKIVATFITVIMLFSGKTDFLSALATNITNNSYERIDLEEMYIPKDKLSLENIPVDIFTSLEYELQNAIELDKECLCQ